MCRKATEGVLGRLSFERAAGGVDRLLWLISAKTAATVLCDCASEKLRRRDNRWGVNNELVCEKQAGGSARPG